ncbi:MAG: hydroxymethylglutaryl-CoA reductase [Saprospiraceae bacterium]|nr:hydroxymethylglutaryl-CoA reductase [Saprospiraceae bacterium]
MVIPSLILKQLYNFNSLENVEGGIKFTIKNRLSDAQFAGLKNIKIEGRSVPLGAITIILDNGEKIAPSTITADNPLEFPLRRSLDIFCAIPHMDKGKHQLGITFVAEPFGELTLDVEDGISDKDENRVVIPRDKEDDYSAEAIQKRLDFVKDYTGVELEHPKHYAFDPHVMSGNCEHFVGVAQVPLGIAGPITVNGEHAKGDFLIPMATSEGTLVASYNRGIKVVNLCGGVKCTVVRDAMQRAPVFVFEDARAARDFVDWVKVNFPKIAEEGESTSSVARLQYIDPYLSNKFAFLRFNYSTGDAAGQNMVGRATFAACSWILDHYKDNEIKHFYLESNFATDKKASQVNIMRTRGKRVTAEITFKRDILIQHMRVEPEQLVYHYGVANIGSILSGANNNGLHSANAITAMFIATGQDVANVSESSAGVVYLELTKEGDLYFSITIPSLIVATYGGGTSLPCQQECLKMLDCVGRDKVNKFAEIVAGVVLAGELSLGAAISSSDWVSSHEQYGRNR